jgi:hypothetical protein
MCEPFFEAVAICLLREPRKTVSSKDTLNAKSAIVKPTSKNLPDKKQNAWQKKVIRSQQEVKSPSFISGYEKDGAPIYQTITVWNIDEEQEEEMGSSSSTTE